MQLYKLSTQKLPLTISISKISDATLTLFKLMRSNLTLSSTQRNADLKLSKMSVKLSAMVLFRQRAKEANSRLRQYLKKLTAKFSAQRMKKRLFQMTKESFASSVMDLKSIRRACLAEDAMALVLSRVSSIQILSKLSRRKSNPIPLKLSRD